MRHAKMPTSVPKLALPLIACLIPLAAGCTLGPYSSLSPEQRFAHDSVAVYDSYYAARAAAMSELADRRVAVDLLRDLATRYRIAGREKVLASLDATLEREGVAGNVVSAQLQVASRQAASARLAVQVKAEAELHALLRQAFDVKTRFGALVHRCVEIEIASAGKPTYNPKLADWLCRAAILPDAIDAIEAGTYADSERWSQQATAIERLSRFAARCTGNVDPSCGDAGNLIAKLINQQPVVPIPQRLNKISVERTAVPRRAAAADTDPPTIQTN